MRPRIWGALAALALGAACAPRQPVAPPPPPDVVLLLVDTLRADALSCYGQPLALTPQMDRLSRRGRLDEQVQAPSPWTKPTLAALFTGLLPRQHGVLKGLHADQQAGLRVDHLPASLPTLAGRFQRKGYRTIGIQTNPHCTSAQGFGRGFDDFRDRLWASGRAVAREAGGILGGAREPPLFLYLHLLDPHTPYVPHPFPFEDGREPCFLAMDDLRLADGVPRVAPDLAEDARRAYFSEILEVDAAVGAVVRAAERRRAWIVLLSDHGEELGDHGGYEHGHTLYEELLHVPRIVASPGRAPALDPRPGALQDLFHEIPELVLGEPAGPPSPLLAEALLYGDERAALREGTSKLVVDPRSALAVGQYDLAQDPAERAPRAGDPELSLRLARLLGEERSAPAPSDDADPATLEALRSLGYTAGKGEP